MRGRVFSWRLPWRPLRDAMLEISHCFSRSAETRRRERSLPGGPCHWRTPMRAQVAVCLSLFSAAAVAKSEDRNVGSFEEVHIAAGIHATIEIGPARPVHLEGDESVLARIET